MLSVIPFPGRPHRHAVRTVVAAAFAASALLLAPAAHAAEVAHVDYPGVQHLHYRYGPLAITPGQNTIVFRPTTQKPSVPGFITRFQPDLRYTDGTVPPVDVLHLHHGVWFMRDYPTFATGEEKTITQFPQGFGYRYGPGDRWVLNYMLHNLEATSARVYLVWDIDFVAAPAAAAAGIKAVKPLWLDTGDGNYPVWDAQRGWGRNGRYTFPAQARGAERAKIGDAHRVRVPFDATLVAAGGHLHPGGLHVDLKAMRGGRARELFRSEARYYEPAGAVSWDVSMTFTKPDWRVAVRRGDTLSVSATYDTRRASWYEVMGIIDPLWYTRDRTVTGADPFATAIDWHGVVTHGHLPENDHHGGMPLPALDDPLRALSGAPASSVRVANFIYGRGDFAVSGPTGLPPTVEQGRSLTFRNLDSPHGGNPARAIYHTVTACRAPCTGAAGVAYPLANGRATFDSGELGFGPRFATAAANRATWRTPKTLPVGTYTYFCRIHPFMRGAFRVVPQ
jgi:hypothetical protein